MALFDFARVKQTIADLAAELQSLRAEREQLLQARETLEAQPACKGDMLNCWTPGSTGKAPTFRQGWKPV